MIRILFLALALGSVACGQSSQSIKLRALCFEYSGDLKEVMLVGGPDGDITTPVKLWTNSFSDEATTTIKDSRIRFAIETPGPDGKTILKTVAEGKAASGSQQLALFFPSTGKLPYKLVMLDDSEKGFPMGSTTAINMAPTPVRFAIGERSLDLKPGAKASIPQPKKVNPRNQANVIISFGNKEGKWTPVNNTRWQVSPLKRNIAISFIHPKTKQPTVKSYADTPPWRKPKLD